MVPDRSTGCGQCCLCESNSAFLAQRLPGSRLCPSCFSIRRKELRTHAASSDPPQHAGAPLSCGDPHRLPAGEPPCQRREVEEADGAEDLMALVLGPSFSAVRAARASGGSNPVAPPRSRLRDLGRLSHSSPWEQVAARAVANHERGTDGSSPSEPMWVQSSRAVGRQLSNRELLLPNRQSLPQAQEDWQKMLERSFHELKLRPLAAWSLPEDGSQPEGSIHRVVGP